MSALNNNYLRTRKKQSEGFSLLELVLVIMVMGIMAAGISGFISLSTQTYMNATNRDELIGNARFAVERLSRELRNAVPNSIRVQDQCIQFSPIVASTAYTDIPVSPEPASKILSVVPFNNSDGSAYQCNLAAGCSDVVTVYPLEDEDIYGDNSSILGKVFQVDNTDTTTGPYQINILNSQNVHFEEDSPTQRLYIANEQVSYCVETIVSAGSGILIRYNEGLISGILSKPNYMAGYLNNNISGNLPFNYQPATLKRNAVVQIHLELTKNDESYVFDHEVHINNVP